MNMGKCSRAGSRFRAGMRIWVVYMVLKISGNGSGPSHTYSSFSKAHIAFQTSPMPSLKSRTAFLALAATTTNNIASASPIDWHHPSNSTLPFTPSSISWQDCSATYGTDFDCANLSVPLDWNEPSGEQIVLGMNRYRPSKSTSLPNLFINFGGPGGIATQGLAEAAAEIPSEVTDVYDISKSFPSIEMACLRHAQY
jgi:hypothetical protein